MRHDCRALTPLILFFTRSSLNTAPLRRFGKGVAQFLEHILLGASVEETIEWVISNRDSMHSMGVWMRLAGALKTGRTVDHSDAIALVGPACAVRHVLGHVLRVVFSHPATLSLSSPLPCTASRRIFGRRPRRGVVPHGPRGGAACHHHRWR